MDGEADIDPEGPNLKLEKEKEEELKNQRANEIADLLYEQKAGALVADYDKFEKHFKNVVRIYYVRIASMVILTLGIFLVGVACFLYMYDSMYVVVPSPSSEIAECPNQCFVNKSSGYQLDEPSAEERPNFVACKKNNNETVYVRHRVG